MKSKNALTNISAAKATASIFGLLAGLGGLTHGVGEVLQGNVASEELWIYSWTQGPIATNMGGEPGITIIPNLLITGTLTLIVSLLVITWAVAFVQRKSGGWILTFLSIIMLLVGGGIGPPVMGILAGVAGSGIEAPSTWWLKHLPINIQKFIGTLWPWIFGIAVINGVFLVIGSLILVYFFDFNNPQLFTNSFFFAAISLLLMIFSGRAYDMQKRSDMSRTMMG